MWFCLNILLKPLNRAIEQHQLHFHPYLHPWYCCPTGGSGKKFFSIKLGKFYTRCSTSLLKEESLPNPSGVSAIPLLSQALACSPASLGAPFSNDASDLEYEPKNHTKLSPD
ncbi:hypothetical protein EK904_007903 [Melospiza melodia maxima]|nr:hypothetical protein EK904_007903 [Melospiza melodia maxima]